MQSIIIQRLDVLTSIISNVQSTLSNLNLVRRQTTPTADTTGLDDSIDASCSTSSTEPDGLDQQQNDDDTIGDQLSIDGPSTIQLPTERMQIKKKPQLKGRFKLRSAKAHHHFVNNQMQHKTMAKCATRDVVSSKAPVRSTNKASTRNNISSKAPVSSKNKKGVSRNVSSKAPVRSTNKTASRNNISSKAYVKARNKIVVRNISKSPVNSKNKIAAKNVSSPKLPVNSKNKKIVVKNFSSPKSPVNQKIRHLAKRTESTDHNDICMKPFVIELNRLTKCLVCGNRLEYDHRCAP